MEWQNWSSLPFLDRDQLPSEPAIYVIVDSENFVWYVGKASNLQNRWMGRGHHRYPQLIRSNKKLQHRIHWKSVPFLQLDEAEKFYIEKFEPELNGLKVKTYLPKESQVHREIKRLLKVLNKNTLLFPTIRSIVAGEYTDDLGNRCVPIVINSNDFTIVFNSNRKRYSRRIRSSWIELESYCGFPEESYRPLLLPAYTFQGYRFEFVEIPEIIFHFEDSLDLQIQLLRSIDIFGISVKALNGLSIFKDLELEEASKFPFYDGRKFIRPIAYIRHIQSNLRPISEGSPSFVLS